MGYNPNTYPNMEKNIAEKRAPYQRRDGKDRRAEIVRYRVLIKFSEVMYTTSGRKQSAMLRPNKHSGFEANHGRIMKDQPRLASSRAWYFFSRNAMRRNLLQCRPSHLLHRMHRKDSYYGDGSIKCVEYQLIQVVITPIESIEHACIAD